MSEQKIPIPSRLYNAAVGGHVCGTEDIIDDDKNKTQKQINSEVEESLGTGGSVNERIAEEGAKHYLKEETYNKSELNNMITTPNQGYVSVIATAQTTAVTDVLPATGAADTTYRVGNWDGTQYNDSVFSEYAWNGSAYIKLSTKSQVGEVYDISANHADTKYADLAAALGTNGANIPQSLRKGGMSVKFVLNSDNKYHQFRLKTQDFSIVESDWEDSAIFFEYLSNGNYETKVSNFKQGSINTNNGSNVDSGERIRSDYFELNKENYIVINCGSDFYFSIYWYDENKQFINVEQNRQSLIIQKGNAKPYCRIVMRFKQSAAILPTENTGLSITNIPEVSFNHRIFKSVADIRACRTLIKGEIVETLGYYSPGDGGGAKYLINVGPGDIGYSATNVALSTESQYLYAILIFGKTIRAKQIGCVSNDPTVNNATFVNNVTNNDYFADCTLVFEKGVYYFSNGILDTKTVHLVGEEQLNYFSYDKDKDARLVFTDVDTSTYNAAIYANYHTLISDLFIYGTFVNYSVDMTKIGTEEPWLEFNVSKEDTIGIKIKAQYHTNYNSVVKNCVVRGFSTGISMHLWSSVNSCLIMECDGYCIESNNDNQISNCRLQFAGNGIKAKNLNIISNIRMDSIKNIGIECDGTNALISSVHGDYIGKCLIHLSGKTGLTCTNIGGRCGVDYVGEDYDDLPDSDKELCAVISLINTNGISISSLNGMIRQLDGGERLANTKAVALSGTTKFNISMASDKDDISNLSDIEERLYIGSNNNGGVIVNSNIIKIANNNIYKGVYEQIIN